jgi:hypothetical protein
MVRRLEAYAPISGMAWMAKVAASSIRLMDGWRRVRWMGLPSMTIKERELLLALFQHVVGELKAEIDRLKTALNEETGRRSALEYQGQDK